MMKTRTTPSFFYDHSQKDTPEVMIDYFLSWTLHCAQDGVGGLIEQYAKRILSQCLFGDPDGLQGQTVGEVKTWKQWERIDLLAEVTVGSEQHVLVFEDKMYSSLREHQLATYKEAAEAYYKKRNVTCHYLLVTAYDSIDQATLDQCKQAGYTYRSLDELCDTIFEQLQAQPTGNDLFDEFWLHWWNDPKEKE